MIAEMVCYATRCYTPIPGLGDAVFGAMAIGALLGIVFYFGYRR
jgi:hypothetical protein